MPPRSPKAATKTTSQRRQGQPTSPTTPASMRRRTSEKPAKRGSYRGKRGR